MTEEREKFTGRDVMEAVSAARKHFGVSRRDLGYEVTRQPEVGKLEKPEDGLVEIEAWHQPGARPAPEEMEDDRGGYRDRDRGGRGRDRDRDRGDHRGGRGRDREGRGPRRDRDHDRDHDRGPRRERDAEEEDFKMPALLPPADVTDAKAILEQLTKGLILGMDLELEIDGIDENEIGLRVRLEGGDVEALLESNAEGLEAIQYLANRILQRDGRVKIRVSYDAGDHRAQEEARLIEKAMRFVEEVRETGKVRKMPPMGPYERRLVHIKLEKEEGIRTYSAGSGFHRRLHIAPPDTEESES